MSIRHHWTVWVDKLAYSQHGILHEVKTGQWSHDVYNLSLLFLNSGILSKLLQLSHENWE